MARAAPGSPIRAERKVRGWLGHLGPCFESEDRSVVISRIRHIAAELAFDEISGENELTEVWRSAYKRWQQARIRAAAVLPHRLALLKQTTLKADQNSKYSG